MLITIIEGADLHALLKGLGVNPQDRSIRSLRVSQNTHSHKVSFKINGGMWTHPMGGLDPQSDYAARLREQESGRIRTLIDPSLPWVIEDEGKIIASFANEDDRDEALAGGDWPDDAAPAYVNL